MKTKLYIVVESGVDSSNDFFANAYVEKSAQQAGEYCWSLLSAFCSEHDIEFEHEISEYVTEDGLSYRVEVQEQEIDI